MRLSRPSSKLLSIQLFKQGMEEAEEDTEEAVIMG